MSKERNSGIVLGLLAGAAIGSLLGVLFTSEKSGQMIKTLRRRVDDLRDDVIDEYEDLRDDAIEHYDDLSTRLRKEVQKLK